MVSNGTEYEIGRGQLRTVDVQIAPDLDITAFGDLTRTFLPSTRTTITIRMEIDREPR